MPTASRVILLPAAVIACLAFGVAAADLTYTARMDGAQNLPEPVKTAATGAVELRVGADGQSIAYRITVDRLANAASADLHLGPATSNGPLVVKFWPHGGTEPKHGEFSGVLAEGTLGTSDLTGPMGGAPLADLLDELKAGNVYVNVHTNDGVDPPNSGPGDYRVGEIRGQLVAK